MSLSTTTGQVATAAVNEVTGQRLVSRAPTEAYKSGWDRIFGKKEEPKDDRIYVWYHFDGKIERFTRDQIDIDDKGWWKPKPKTKSK